MSIIRKYSIGKNVILLFAAAIMLSPFYISFVLFNEEQGTDYIYRFEISIRIPSGKLQPGS